MENVNTFRAIDDHTHVIKDIRTIMTYKAQIPVGKTVQEIGTKICRTGIENSIIDHLYESK